MDAEVRRVNRTHNELFDRQDALDDEMLVRYAIGLGLDRDRFVGDLVSHRFVPRIREDLVSGNDAASAAHRRSS